MNKLLGIQNPDSVKAMLGAIQKAACADHLNSFVSIRGFQLAHDPPDVILHSKLGEV